MLNNQLSLDHWKISQTKIYKIQSQRQVSSSENRLKNAKMQSREKIKLHWVWLA